MVFNNSILLGAAGQGGVAPFDTTLIGNSIWLEGARTSGDAMTRTWGAESNQDRWIWATWYQPLRVIDAESKRNNLFASGSVSNGFYLNHTSTSSTFNLFHRDNAGNEGAINTTESYRDTTSWIHVLVDYDSANANAANRISLYINGVRTGVNSGNRPGQNNHLNTNVQNQTARIGQDLSTTPDYHVQGYLAQTIFLDNKSIANGDLAITDFLDTFTFGTNGSQIVPKADADIIALASAAGANSFCLNYSDASSAANLVSDASSKGNNFSTSTIATANQSLHSPSKVYATWNALDSALDGHNTDMTLSDGGTVTEDGNGAFCRSTFSIPEGLFSYRVTVDDSTANQMFGVALDTATDRANANTNHPNMYAVNTSNGGRNTNGSGSSAVSGYSWSDGDTMEVYVSRSGTTYKIWYGKNGTLLNNAAGSQGDPSAGTNELFSFTHTGDVFFSVDYTNPGTKKATTDFGQRGYSPAEGALTLSTPNLLTPSYQGIDYFDATLYEGNGTGQRVGDFVPFTDAYTVDKSAMFDIAQQNRLTRDFVTPTDADRFVFSSWLKLSNKGQRVQPFYSGNTGSPYTSNGTDGVVLELDPTNSSYGSGLYYTKSGNGTILQIPTNLEQESEWFHFLISYEESPSEGAGTNGANKLKVYVNGVQQTLTLIGGGGSITTPGWNASGRTFVIGAGQRSPAQYFSGYVAETVFIDGGSIQNGDVSLSNFGSVDTSTNRWVAANISGQSFTFGNNGFYLEYEGDFSSVSLGNDAGKDSSGEGHHFVQGSFNAAWTAANQFTDTPSKNFDNLGGAQVGGTITEGNTKAALGTGGNQIRSNFNLSSGKWYVESDIQATNDSASIGLVPSRSATFSNGPGRDSNGGISYETDGDVFSDNVQNATAEASFAAGDVIQMAIDMDAKKVYFGKNNTFGGNPAAGTGGHFLPASILSDGAALITLGNYSGSQSSTQQINYGQFLNFDGGSTTNGFKYTPPTGFQAVNQDNLDDTASKITAWAWIKNRDADDDHVIVDRARGINKVWESNTNTAAFTNPNTVQRFLQRGVQIGSDVTVNTANESYVLWQWLVGDSATTGSTTSPAGSIPSTTIVADTGHFSVGTYTGTGADNATIGHGLGGIPEMIIVRNLSRSTFGLVWHTNGGGATHTADFAVTATFSANSQKFGGSDASNPTADVFKIGTHNEINANTESFVFYALRSIPGVCKIGSYEGNASSNGAYISLGFKPRYFLVKNLDTAGQDWRIYDTAIEPINPNDQFFKANDDAAQISSSGFDFLSNAVKARDGNSGFNSSATFIYMAMAEIGGNGTLPPIYGR